MAARTFFDTRIGKFSNGERVIRPMSKKFDAEAYVSRWDDILIPVMLVVIIGSMIGAYALNVWARPDCTTHDYVFCGTPLDQPAEEGGHGEAGSSEHGAPAGHGEADPHGGHEHGGEAHPH